MILLYSITQSSPLYVVVFALIVVGFLLSAVSRLKMKAKYYTTVGLFVINNLELC